MAKPRNIVQRSTALKVTANVVAFIVGGMLGFFVEGVCRWLGMREQLLFAIRLVSMGIVFLTTRAAIYGIADSLGPKAVSNRAASEDFRQEGPQEPMSKPVSAAAVPTEQLLRRFGRGMYIMITVIPPMIILFFSAIVCWLLFEEKYATKYEDVLSMALLLTVWLPLWICAGVQRFHDLDRSGWWVLTALIPIFQWAVVIYLFCCPGTPGRNRFGLNEDESMKVAPKNWTTAQ